MSDEDIRRVRRILTSHPEAPAAVEPRQVERFQRALSGSRRAVTSPLDALLHAPSSPSEPAASATPAPHPMDAGPAGGVGGATTMASAGRSPGMSLLPVALAALAGARRHGSATSARGTRQNATEDAARDAFRQALEEPAAVAAAVPARATSGTAGSSLAPAVETPPLPLQPMLTWNALPEDWEHTLVDTVAELCRASDPAFHSWTVKVPLDPEALPHTELRLSFSPHHLRLRFSTQSTLSQALVSAHQDQLCGLLRDALPTARDIDIDLT